MENWESQIKDIFELTNFNLVLSGSSLINILENSIDLSRRIVSFEIPPLSFREYLLFKKGVEIKKIDFEDLLDFKFRNKKILEIAIYEKYFNDYLKFGAYPFSEDLVSTIDSFKNILNKTIYVDFVKIRNIDEKSLFEILKILKYISSRDDEISVTSLSNNLGVSKTKVI